VDLFLEGDRLIRSTTLHVHRSFFTILRHAAKNYGTVLSSNMPKLPSLRQENDPEIFECVIGYSNYAGRHIII